MPPTNLDAVDRALLKLVQQDNRLALRELADRLGISAPTCLRRLRRLEASGVILAQAALLNAALVGWPVLAFVEVSLEAASGAEMTAFERRMGKCPEVLQCCELAGDVDYMLTVVATDMQSFSGFARKHFADNPKIRAYRSLMVMKRTKNEHRLPL
jgi:Lrp/AsnC family leucine-responsive transcriptional regulator